GCLPWLPVPLLRPASTSARPGHPPARRFAGSMQAGQHAGFLLPWSCSASRRPVRNTVVVLDSCFSSRFLAGSRHRYSRNKFSLWLDRKKVFFLLYFLA